MGLQGKWARQIAQSLAMGAFVAGTFAGAAAAFPGGTPEFQTDVAPFCAGCHSSTQESDMSGLGGRGQSELAQNKHYAAIQSGAGRYAELSQADRAKLVEMLVTVDRNSTVALEFPASVTPGETFQVTAKVTGGAGPAVGIALVDRAHRLFARPASALGWEVVGAPTIIGPKGPQSNWIERRPEREGRGITFVNVEGMHSSADADKWSRAKIIFTLRAPQAIGSYPLVAAYFYGTETGISLSTRMHPDHGKVPLGGPMGMSGRIKFSDKAMISVKAENPQPVAGVPAQP